MISRDPNIVREGSVPRARFHEYKTLVDDLQVIVIGRGFLKTEWRPFDRFDLVTAQDPFEAGILGLMLSFFYGAELQVQVHTDFLSPYFAKESLVNTLRARIARWVLRKASCVRVVSRRIAESLVRESILLQSQISILPILSEAHVSKEGPSLRERYPQFDPIILMASRITREKNISLAIQAFRGVQSRHPRAGLVIAGSGPELGALRKKVEEDKLSKSVVFEGWSDSLGSYYASADVFLLTSNYEGYGLSLLDAARANASIVTTDVGLAGDLLGPSEAGIVPPGDGGALCAELIRTLGDSELRASRKEKAYKALEKLPSKETYLQRYKELWMTCGKR